MVRDAQIRYSRAGQYGLVDKMHLKQGIVRGHPDGFGFLIPEDGSSDILLNALQMTCLFDGDQALVRLTGRDYRGRHEGKVVDVLTRNTEQLVGRFHRIGALGMVKPENRRVALDVIINTDDDMNAEEGDIVVVDILVQPRFRQQPIGKITEILGQHMEPGMETDIAIRSFNIPDEWPPAVQNSIDSVPQLVKPADITGRIDLRKLPLVTIDGEDARDFDDAVCAQKTANGWSLWVAIADVAHYVQPGTALDQEATRRGTSVYFPDRVVPMLPEALSNGICSLNPGVDRLATVCEMQLNDNGELQSYQFYNAVIHSHARLTYTQVAAMLIEPETEDGQSALSQFNTVIEPLKQLYQLFKHLLKSRKLRGAIDFDAPETRILFNDQGKIDQIVPVIRNQAHRLIEECMLIANTCAADFIHQEEIPGLFRVHEQPGPEKLDRLKKFLNEHALTLGGGLNPKPAHFQSLLDQIATREDSATLQLVILRSLTQAKYQSEMKEHFGLGYKSYTHFTSPIRRYPDLLTHRAIKSVIHSKKKSPRVRRPDHNPLLDSGKIYPYSLERMVVLGEHCSMTERRADDATRDVVTWLKCEFMQEKIGDEYEGKIVAVVPFGLFIQLDDIFVEGLVHITSLRSDYYTFNEIGHRLVGENTGITYKIGDRLSIQVARVDLDERKIDFELPGQTPRSTVKPGKSRRNSGKKAKTGKKGRDESSLVKPKKTKAKKKSPKPNKSKH